jgi:L-methionine (R)-S-oxide reductase
MDVLRSNGSPDCKLKQLCVLLRDSVPGYDWVGFYLVDRNREKELVLGPFAGAPTEHTRIDFGRGICGQAASTLEVFVVDDVSLSDNYLSCSPDVRSEFVAPVMFRGELVGELDLDSHRPSAFGPEHRVFLEWIAEVTAEEVARRAGFAE